MTRRNWVQHMINNEIECVKNKIQERLKEKGWGSFSSRHEILGVIAEEYQELIESVKSRKDMSTIRELEDIAVACILGMATEDYKLGDW